MDPGDADAVATALREAREEVGLDATWAGVEVVGGLDALWIPPSNFRVVPIVAVAARRPVFVQDRREVAAILEVPVTAFLPDVAPVIIDPDPSGREAELGAGDLLEHGVGALAHLRPRVIQRQRPVDLRS